MSVLFGRDKHLGDRLRRGDVAIVAGNGVERIEAGGGARGIGRVKAENFVPENALSESRGEREELAFDVQGDDGAGSGKKRRQNQASRLAGASRARKSTRAAG